MERFEHGGYPCGRGDVIDFSANLNPLGMPAGVREALRQAVDSLEGYPDPESRELRDAIARACHVPAAWVLPCAGATDAISRICLALRPRAGLVPAPGYSGYEQALEQAGARVVRHALREQDGFALREDILDDLDGVGIAFLANPNNPTGLLLEPGLLARIVEEAARRGMTVALDESFIGFTDEPGAAPLLRAHPNLVIVRSFTKLYAMAGVRLGYLLCSSPSAVDACRAAGQPWAVSTSAQMAGIAALKELDFARQTRAYVGEQRMQLRGGLEALGLRTIPSQANYLLFSCARPLHGPLLERGIAIRRCEDFPGLGRGWYRVAVRTAAENARLLAALEEVLA